MSVTATATGVVCAHENSLCVSPSGDVSFGTSYSLFGFVLPDVPAFGLVGRVGNGPWVQVGTGPTTLSGTGALVFSVNDHYLLFGDNSGSFSVTVTQSSACFPGWGRGDTKHRHVGPPGRLDSCYPGNGYGDTNHWHSGPPGRTDTPKGGNQGGGGASASNSPDPPPTDPPAPPSHSNKKP